MQLQLDLHKNDKTFLSYNQAFKQLHVWYKYF